MIYHLKYFSLQRPTALSAPEYIDHLMDWVQNQIFDETIFPRDCSTEFPKNFQKTCKKILARMYRVFVHVYIHHFDKMTIIHISNDGHFDQMPIILIKCPSF